MLIVNEIIHDANIKWQLEDGILILINGNLFWGYHNAMVKTIMGIIEGRFDPYLRFHQDSDKQDTEICQDEIRRYGIPSHPHIQFFFYLDVNIILF